MATQEKKGGNLIAIATMFALYALVGFVTYLAAPAGKIWESAPGITGTLGMMGNMMNFAAYLFMGYPLGMILQKFGYKTTALLATGSGALGIIVQLISGHVDLGTMGGVPGAWIIYLVGAFISGTSNCLLNGVICPMLNQIVGGGNKGNQLNLAGGAFQGIFQGAAPIVLGSIVGEVTATTKFSEVTGVLSAAAITFIVATAIIAFIPLKDPVARAEGVVYERSALAFRHCLLGVIGIFLYMGVEAGIPAAMLQVKGMLTCSGDIAAKLAGSLAGAVFITMLCGRLLGAIFGGKISPRAMLLGTAGLGLVLVIAGVALIASGVTVPLTIAGESVAVPVGAFCFVAIGFCTSVMWSVIFNLSTEGLGKYTEQASGLFMTMVVGGGILPLVQSYICDKVNFTVSFIVPALCLAYLFAYAAFLTKNVNTDIKID